MTIKFIDVKFNEVMFTYSQKANMKALIVLTTTTTFGTVCRKSDYLCLVQKSILMSLY